MAEKLTSSEMTTCGSDSPDVEVFGLEVPPGRRIEVLRAYLDPDDVLEPAPVWIDGIASADG